jgi:hypothetical protein
MRISRTALTVLPPKKKGGRGNYTIDPKSFRQQVKRWIEKTEIGEVYKVSFADSSFNDFRSKFAMACSSLGYRISTRRDNNDLLVMRIK